MLSRDESFHVDSFDKQIRSLDKMYKVTACTGYEHDISSTPSNVHLVPDFVGLQGVQADPQSKAAVAMQNKRREEKRKSSPFPPFPALETEIALV